MVRCPLAFRRFCAHSTFVLPRLPRPVFPSKRSAARYRCAAFLVSVVTALAWGTIQPLHAALRVRDDAPHAGLWFRLYDDLPRAWKTRRTVLLREVSPRDMERLVAHLEGGEADRNDDSVVDGCYQNDGEDEYGSPTITLCDTLRGEQAALVFTHEYGHFVWDETLSEEQRARYTRVWKSQKRAHHLVTEYAQDSEEEGFCEAFAYFIRRPAQLQRKDSASAQFLRDVAAGRVGDSAP